MQIQLIEGIIREGAKDYNIILTTGNSIVKQIGAS